MGTDKETENNKTETPPSGPAPPKGRPTSTEILTTAGAYDLRQNPPDEEVDAFLRGLGKPLLNADGLTAALVRAGAIEALADAGRHGAAKLVDGLIKGLQRKKKSQASGNRSTLRRESGKKLPSRNKGATGSASSSDDIRETDMGNASRLVDGFGHMIRYCGALGGWWYFDGTRWKLDRTGLVQELAKEIIRAMLGDAETSSDGARIKWALKSQDVARVRAAIALAATDRRIAVEPNVFDLDPWLFNVVNGKADRVHWGVAINGPRSMRTTP